MEVAMDIIWEKTKDGTFAQCQYLSKVRSYLPFLKQTALSKILDVTIISAEFHEIPVVFVPQVLLLLDRGSQLEFFGAYISSDMSRENNSDSLPSFCCRKVTWDQRDDYESFKASDNKSNYILTDKQLVSEICFLNTEQQSTFDILASEILDIVRLGTKFEEVERKQVPCNDIKLKVVDGFLDFSCLYTPYTAACQAIEDWIPNWCSCFEKLYYSACYMPDSTIHIGYNYSFFDRVKMMKYSLQEQ